MATQALFNISFKTSLQQLVAYGKERFPWRLALPLSALMLFFAVAIGSESWSWAYGAPGFLWLMVALFQLRLLDDLSEVEVDRHKDPKRFLCRQKSLRGFWRAANFLGVIGLVLSSMFLSLVTAGLYAGLLFLAGLWYFTFRGSIENRELQRLLPLLKYPFLAFALAAGSPGGLTPGSVFILPLIYFSFAIYEQEHDPNPKMADGAKTLWRLYFLSAALLALLGGAEKGLFTWGWGLSAFIFGAVFVRSFGQSQRRTSAASHYGVFILSLLWSIFIFQR
jgi:hypothetical protein